MAAAEQPTVQPQPYTWDDAAPPPPETLRLWTEVGSGIDKSQTVVWKSAVLSLDQATKFLNTTEVAREFVEKYMSPIISILVEQQPTKIGPHERNCVQDSLQLAVVIVARDLDIQLNRRGQCNVLDVLALVFNKKKAYYKGSKGNWNVSHLSGLPEFRLKMIDRFRSEGGFALLHKYLRERIATPMFPSLDLLHQILQAIGDAVPNRTPVSESSKEMEEAAIAVAKAVMEYITGASDDALKKIPPEQLSTVLRDLQKIFDRLVASRRNSTYEFYGFWRALILKLITSQSLPLKLFGWEQMNELIDASAEHRPPPRGFSVTNAGCGFVNGEYVFAGATTEDGYALRGAELSYERRIPDGEEGGGKKLTLFRCTMRSQQKWWFLSEADEEQPGTDRDIDYYQHKSKEHEETEPPPRGWVTCRNDGVDPPPHLMARGLMVPAGQEYNTLDHQLAKWAIENGIIEQVLGDSVHREIVARSTHLIKFLASMCERDRPTDSTVDIQPNQYCLGTQHLLLAWKTCTRKADAAVSHQVYQLLVSILPACPSGLAIPLLKAVQTSLSRVDHDGKGDYVAEVAEFCSALSSANPVDAKSGASMTLAEDVRSEVLELFWAVLTHPDASSLKTYDGLKRYVTSELRVEPIGSNHRAKFMRSCIEALSASAEMRGGAAVDEDQALRMVKLTHFVLESSPREQARVAVENNEDLPSLLFKELTAFIERRKDGPAGHNFVRKNSTAGDSIPPRALSERLRILRYVYGLSEKIVMSSQQLHALWQLCHAPADREELMIFIASASGKSSFASAKNPVPMDTPAQQPQTTQSEDMLFSVFSEEVCSSAFLDLFCSRNVSYDLLGEGGYRSFQYMFKQYPPGPYATTRGPALDALWRICLLAGNDTVAQQAMKDLLAVYISMASTGVADNGWTDRPNSVEQMETDEKEESFGKRVFDCLASVRKGLDKGDVTAERSAARCLKILNAAIGQSGDGVNSMTASTLARLASVSQDGSLTDTLLRLPHGMRGQACYRRIGVMAKRTVVHTQQGPQVYPAREDGIGPTPPPHPRNSTLRFSLDVHPLETLASVKAKVAVYCGCSVSSIKPISISGRLSNAGRRNVAGESGHMNIGTVPDDTVVDELGLVQGCEIVFTIAEKAQLNAPNAAVKNLRVGRSRDLSDIFCSDDDRFADRLFRTLLGVLEALPWRDSDMMTDGPAAGGGTHHLVWDLLLAMPTNASVAAQVRQAAGDNATSSISDEDAMEVDSSQERWSALLDLQSFHRSVYVLLAIDAFLQPAQEVLSILPVEQRMNLEGAMQADAVAFRRGFIESGGFDAVVRFFSMAGANSEMNQEKTRMANAVALRILKCCLYGNSRRTSDASVSLDEAGSRLLRTLSNADGLLTSLTAMVVGDGRISTSTISDVLKLLRLLFQFPETAKRFVALRATAENFLITLLMWEGGSESSKTSSSMGAAAKVRKTTRDLILSTSILADYPLAWLNKAIDMIEVTSESTSDYFDVLGKLIAHDRNTARTRSATETELRNLGTAVCKKLSSCPRPTSEVALIDFSTGVLCGCLALLRALIEHGGGSVLRAGTNALVEHLGVSRWSEMAFGTRPRDEDLTLIDLMGAIFDGFLSPGGSSSVVSICCDKESRQRGFDVVGAAARSCQGPDGYMALVNRVNKLVSSAAPHLRHRWGQVGGSGEGHARPHRNTSKYSGLRNQGCTCYMNSVLQQMFMMPELRKVMCAAPLPATLRSTGGVISAKGAGLVGKKVTMHWDNGNSYDAIVEAFDEETGMHTIQYCPIHVAVGGSGHSQVQPEDISRLPPPLNDEFFLSEGRPGKETGVFEVVSNGAGASGERTSGENTPNRKSNGVEETEDEASSRHLLEEVQRTFIHLDEGSRGRCFDPRALVEACACLKLEFDVWQQNDASEFATKLLDRLEISLKRWAPTHFRYLDHTFGLKQTKQKICKECGLKTNREEKSMNIDCQIRGKSDIHEALAAMTEVEIMEGNNKVFCDRCKKNTDTLLRTAISTLPNMLILSLKRFDLDYTTFETVKLNSRCAFGQTLNMKRYTLEGQTSDEDEGDPSPMDTTDSNPTSEAEDEIPDDDYEYKLAGVLVHAGVAQGGHYYSFIRDRNPGSEEKWYRFDDEDVTPFDPASIEVECFGGKVKKETKWPNGQVHTVESEQFANALMLFYEKVKPSDAPPESEEDSKDEKDKARRAFDKAVEKTSGYDVFEPDVRRSNATHRWQTFLFDAEFHTFLKGLLGLCRLSSSDAAKSAIVPGASSDVTEKSWRAEVVEMLLGFVFDVLLYSAEKVSLKDWIRMLEETLSRDIQSARTFTRLLACKTQLVSPNWLRTYLLDCPDQASRNAAVRIFSAAIQSCVSIEEEAHALGGWIKGWREQLTRVDRPGLPTPLPCKLEGEWAAYEDCNAIQDPRTSSLGIIISFLTFLTEAVPRSWRYNPEFCLLIRNMANTVSSSSGGILRKAMVEAVIPARLVCLVIRERASPALRAAFPGACVSIETAESQMRPESNPTAHMIPLTGNQVLNPAEGNSRGAPPVPSEMLTLFEALGCLLHLEGTLHEPLCTDADDTSRGRQRSTLTDRAVSALSTIFQESCGSVAGMGQREIEMYLQRCGVDSASVSPQKIVDIMAKYPTSSGNGTKGSSYLSLEGFLAYYRDTAQSNEIRVRMDLHTFGFRPDLTRRSREARIYVTGGREQLRNSTESVVLDVASSLDRRGPLLLGSFAEVGLFSFSFWSMAYSASEPLAETLLAGITFGRDINMLLVSTLKNIYQAPSGWTGNETLSAAVMVLRVVALVPDDRQHERIALMMQCQEKAAHLVEHGAGLLVASRVLYGSRPTQHYSSDMNFAVERYLGILKELLNLEPTYLWLQDHASLWSWMERDLMDSHHAVPQQNHMRIDYPIDGSSVPVDQLHSDPDMPVQDSEEDDEEDSRLGMESFTPAQLVVEGAGQPAVNGVYNRAGFFEKACSYTRKGDFKGEMCVFTLFQCSVSNNTKHWYISIVPAHGQPGTSTDIDFYSAPVTESCMELPPSTGWTQSTEGREPPPRISFSDQRVVEPGSRGRPEPVWNNNAGGGGPNGSGGVDDKGRMYI